MEPRKLRANSVRKFLPVAMALALLLIAGLGRFAFADNGYGNVQASVTPSLNQGTSPADTSFTVVVTATPSTAVHMVVSLTTSLNASTVDSQSCTLSIVAHQTGSCVFLVPYSGNGEYLFTASGSDKHGNTLFAQAIDPFIELEW